MQRRSSSAIGFLVGLALVASGSTAQIPVAAEEPVAAFAWGLPAWSAPPPVPADNPMTEAGVELGRHLFFDPRLSSTGTMSCASCHDPSLAFTDGRTVAIGITGDRHRRNTPSILNAAYRPILNWSSPQVHLLEFQLLRPLFGTDPVEMGQAGREAALLAALARDPQYPDRFAQAFPDDPAPLRLANLARALATYQRSLVSTGSAYERFRFGGDPDAISATARRGADLFFSDALGCASCHAASTFNGLLTDGDRTPVFANTGLYNLDGTGAYPDGNEGFFRFTEVPTDTGRFRTPSLRNVTLTAPYMHDGSVATLEEVLAIYAAGGRLITDGPLAGDGRANPYKDPRVTGFMLGEDDQAALLAFLDSLVDEAVPQREAVIARTPR